MTDRPVPLAMMRSEEALFTVYPQGAGVMLVMRPHGVPENDDREIGWRLTMAEVDGLRTLLAEVGGGRIGCADPDCAFGILEHERGEGTE